MVTTQRDKWFKQWATHYAAEAQMRGCRAVVHLENERDEYFWSAMLRKYAAGDYYFHSYSKSEKGNDTSGCTQCLQFKNYLSDKFFVCIDSDYRWLRQEKDIISNKYILQTYTYSWENHCCFVVLLQENFKAKCPESAAKFDFSVFLREYSKTVYEPLLLYLYMKKNNLPGFGQKEINKISAMQYRRGDAENNGQTVIDRIRDNFSSFSFCKNKPAGFDFEKEKIFYEKLGLLEDNAYLHFRGHNLYNLINSIGSALCSGFRMDFEKDVLQAGLKFDAYWEIEKCGKDIQKI